MSTQNIENKEDNFENVQSALSKTEQFIEKNQKALIIAAGAIFVLIAGYYGIKKFYTEPRNVKAENSIFSAQQYFEKDSFKLALNGETGNFMGFKTIADKYSSTKAGNLAKYYAGLCYLNMGQYNEAINSLKDFSSDDEIMQYVAKGAIGDAYLELGQKDKALNYYEEAAEGDNDLVAPAYLFKMGLIYEEQGKTKNAIEVYTKIKDKYKTSAEARTIDKFITRATLKAGK
jgi:tetratricopeptide (TPR) repeat protein